MECLECSWLQFQMAILFTLIFSIIGAFLGILLIKYPFKPKIEKDYEKNSKIIRKKMINHLNDVSYWMGRLFEQLEKINGLDLSKNSSCDITSEQFDQIKYSKKRINELWKKIQILHGSTSSIIFNEYMAIQKYVTAIHAIIQIDNSNQNYIFFDLKALEFVWYYAKIIVSIIDKKELGTFYTIWGNNFTLKGGIDKIERPKIEPGDVLTLHNDLNDELFYYDAKFSGIMEGFREVMKEFGVVKEELKKLQEK